MVRKNFNVLVISSGEVPYIIASNDILKNHFECFVINSENITKKENTSIKSTRRNVTPVIKRRKTSTSTPPTNHQVRMVADTAAGADCRNAPIPQ